VSSLPTAKCSNISKDIDFRLLSRQKVFTRIVNDRIICKVASLADCVKGFFLGVAVLAGLDPAKCGEHTLCLAAGSLDETRDGLQQWPDCDLPVGCALGFERGQVTLPALNPTPLRPAATSKTHPLIPSQERNRARHAIPLRKQRHKGNREGCPYDELQQLIAVADKQAEVGIAT